MIKKTSALSTHTYEGSARRNPRARIDCSRGFTLIEALVSLFLLGVVGVLIGVAYTFSVKSQQDSSLQLKAARSAGQILEVLRTASFESIEPIESGWPSFSDFSPREKRILTDIQDSLLDNGLTLYLTIRKHEDREDTKYLAVNVLSSGISSGVSAVAQGEISVRMATLVTRRGLNP